MAPLMTMSGYYASQLPRQHTPPDVYPSQGLPIDVAAANSLHNGYPGNFDYLERLPFPAPATGNALRDLSASSINALPRIGLNNLPSMARNDQDRRAPAPVLPPIRIPDASMQTGHHLYGGRTMARAASGPAAAEEKVAGGVAAHLDYEMDVMVDYVAEMAQTIVFPKSSVDSSFRAYVSSILTSTRLPSSTLILALHYLNVRVESLVARRLYQSRSNLVYHMLTTALMLASKFLDDNTFQNRSWAEVSQISVTELNRNECEWLVGVSWNLHIDATDPQGFALWLQQWERFQANRMELSLETLKLSSASVDPFIQPQHSGKYLPPPTPLYTPYQSSTPLAKWNLALSDRPSPTTWASWAPRLSSGKDQPSPSHWTPPWNVPSTTRPEPQFSPKWTDWPAATAQPPSQSFRRLSPPSAGPSGPATPEWYGRPGLMGYAAMPPTAWPPRSSMSSLPLPMLPSHPSAFDAAGSTQLPMLGGPWNVQHGLGCGCGYCPLQTGDRYSFSHSHGAQPVMG